MHSFLEKILEHREKAKAITDTNCLICSDFLSELFIAYETDERIIKLQDLHEVCVEYGPGSSQCNSVGTYIEQLINEHKDYVLEKHTIFIDMFGDY